MFKSVIAGNDITSLKFVINACSSSNSAASSAASKFSCSSCAAVTCAGSVAVCCRSGSISASSSISLNFRLTLPPFTVFTFLSSGLYAALQAGFFKALL